MSVSDREWALVGVVVLLICVVVGVGLVQGEIDATAVALALITGLFAWITGLVSKGRFGGGEGPRDRDRKDDEP